MSDANSSRPTMDSPLKAPIASDSLLMPAKFSRYGGRHLIFRAKSDERSWMPRPYLLISPFTGPVWVFYGIGQIWLTHRKRERLENWWVRAPRIRSRRLWETYEQLKPHLLSFVQFCNSEKIEGTLVLEHKVIEFHWTFGPERAWEKHKVEHCERLEAQFQRLVDAFHQGLGLHTLP